MEGIKKIIFTVTNDISYDQRMARICESLSRSGYEVEIVGRKRKNSVPLEHKSYKQTRLSCFFQKGKFFYLEYNIRLFFYVLFTSAHVISAIDLDSLLACTIVAKVRSKKLVFDAHEYFTEVPEVTHRKLIKKIWGTVANVCIPQVNAAYTVGESLAELFTKKYNKKFHAIRNVPYLSNHYITESLNHQIILYQGDLNEGRGLEELIEAMKNIDAECWIAGDGLLMDRLKNQVLHTNVENKVKFLGYVRPGELKELTQKASIGINLLQNKGLSYYYSLANKFFDYMHAGIPQLCAPFPEYEKINKECQVAILCECKTVTIENTLKSLLQDASLYEKLRSNTIEARQVYNWQKEEQKLVKIYADVCK